MIRFSCARCGKTIQVKPELAGRKGKCPGCQAVLEIPAASEIADPSPAFDFTTTPAAPPTRKPTAPSFPGSSAVAPEDEFSSFSPSFSTPSNSGSRSSARSMEDRTSENTGLPLGLGIGGLVLGVISLLFTCCVPLVQLPLAGIGLGLGIGGIVTSKGQKGASRILPILGTIFSGIGVVLAIAMLALIFVGAPILGESFRQKIEEIEQRERAKNEFEIDLNDSPGQ